MRCGDDGFDHYLKCVLNSKRSKGIFEELVLALQTRLLQKSQMVLYLSQQPTDQAQVDTQKSPP